MQARSAANIPPVWQVHSYVQLVGVLELRTREFLGAEVVGWGAAWSEACARGAIGRLARNVNELALFM